MDQEELLVTDAGAVRTLTINRPKSRNGLTVEFNARLMAAFAEAGESKAVRSIVLSGAGGHFCSGLDMRSAMAEAGTSDEAREERMRAFFHGLVRVVRACPKPVIALVDGAAVGFGMDLALACDLRVATERARFAELFVRRGLMPDGGGTWSLPRLIGVGRALELMFTGDEIGAEEALRFGLVNRVAKVEEAAAVCAVLAGRCAEGAPLVQARTKAAVYAAQASDLDAALETELHGQMALLKTQDFAEGVLAFFQKRAPVFKGE